MDWLRDTLSSLKSSQTTPSVNITTAVSIPKTLNSNTLHNTIDTSMPDVSRQIDTSFFDSFPDNTSKSVPTNITLPKDLKRRFQSRLAEEGRTMSSVIQHWIKLYLSTVLVLVCISKADTTYTTSDILSFIEKPLVLPDLTLKAQGKGGYGTPEMYDSPAKLDAKASLLCEMSLLSTAEIRSRKERILSRRSSVLDNLAEIQARFNTLSFLYTQLKAYKERRSIIEERIKKGFAEQQEIFPVERYLIDIQSKIQQELSSLKKSQLEIAALAEHRWEELYSVVKLWDRIL